MERISEMCKWCVLHVFDGVFAAEVRQRLLKEFVVGNMNECSFISLWKGKTMRLPAKWFKERLRVSRTARLTLLTLLVFAGVIAAAPALEVKIASVAPENSPYGSALNQLAADWQRISRGSVRVVIYHNGIAGDQADIIRKIRIGQLQGGIFANTGLAPLAKEAMSVTVPFLIRNDEEFQVAMELLRPILDQHLESQGFKPIAWAAAGWLYLFTKDPVRSPDEVKSLKLAVPPDEGDLLETFRSLGFRAVPVDIPETLTALNSGMVNAILSSPLLAAGYQWFGIARNMLDLRIAPAMGCILLSDRTWRQIPQNFRAPFLESARNAEVTLRTGLKALDTQAIDAMAKYGLRVIATTPSETLAWQHEFERNRDSIIDSAFDPKTVELIEQKLAELRADSR